jgi:hypothetical protein
MLLALGFGDIRTLNLKTIFAIFSTPGYIWIVTDALYSNALAIYHLSSSLSLRSLNKLNVEILHFLNHFISYSEIGPNWSLLCFELKTKVSPMGMTRCRTNLKPERFEIKQAVMKAHGPGLLKIVLPR